MAPPLERPVRNTRRGSTGTSRRSSVRSWSKKASSSTPDWQAPREMQCQGALPPPAFQERTLRRGRRPVPSGDTTAKPAARA